MYSTEQRRIAMEAFITFDYSYIDTIDEMGYPIEHYLAHYYRDNVKGIYDCRTRAGARTSNGPRSITPPPY